MVSRITNLHNGDPAKLLLDTNSVVVSPRVFEGKVDRALGLASWIHVRWIVLSILRLDQCVGCTAGRKAVYRSAVARDCSSIDDGSGGISVQEDVIERWIVVDGEAAADDHSGHKGYVVGKADARSIVIVVLRDLRKCGQIEWQSGEPDRVGSGLTGYAGIMQKIDTLFEVLPTQAEIDGEILGDLIVILEVQGPVRLLEGDVGVSVRELFGCDPGKGIVDALEGKGAACVWKEDVG